jgi:hypothetical protein
VTKETAFTIATCMAISQYIYVNNIRNRCSKDCLGVFSRHIYKSLLSCVVKTKTAIARFTKYSSEKMTIF